MATATFVVTLDTAPTCEALIAIRKVILREVKNKGPINQAAPTCTVASS